MKDERSMDTYKATIRRDDKHAYLILNVDSDVLVIGLTEDKPNEVKNAFNKLINCLKEGQFNFVLDDTKEDLYHFTCKEYINQLNLELISVYEELDDYGLIPEPQDEHDNSDEEGEDDDDWLKN